jgi:hypothetical protein
MPNQSILILRVAVTLSCLVGVPAIALMGIRSAESTSSHRDASAAETSGRQAGGDGGASGSRRAVDRPTLAQRAAATDATPSDLAPNATIREVAIDAALPVGATDVDEAAYVEPAGGDRLAQRLHRLQQLGATYHRLESSPSAAAEFHFHCRVAGFERAFEAIDPVAANAVGRVVREVEAARRDSARTRASKEPASVYLR